MTQSSDMSRHIPAWCTATIHSQGRELSRAGLPVHTFKDSAFQSRPQAVTTSSIPFRSVSVAVRTVAAGAAPMAPWLAADVDLHCKHERRNVIQQSPDLSSAGWCETHELSVPYVLPHVWIWGGTAATHHLPTERRSVQDAVLPRCHRSTHGQDRYIYMHDISQPIS